MADALEKLEKRVRALRRRQDRPSDDMHGSQASWNIKRLRELRELIDSLMDDEILRGREHGAPWASLGTSKQQAQQRHRVAYMRNSPTGLPPGAHVLSPEERAERWPAPGERA